MREPARDGEEADVSGGEKDQAADDVADGDTRPSLADRSHDQRHLLE